MARTNIACIWPYYDASSNMLKVSPTRLIIDLVLINISFSYKNVILKILNCLVFRNVEKLISLERPHSCLHSG